jgi:hypothetical protein
MTGFHDDFLRTMRGAPQGAAAVYANGVVLGAVRALADNFPTVEAMLGAEAFEAAAVDHVLEHPPQDPVLATYGATFPAWLARFEPFHEWPWLSPVARLDRAWTEAHTAADARVLTLADLSRLGPDGMTRPLTPHPSLSVFLFDWTAPSLWRAHREPGDHRLVWDQVREGLAIFRPHDVVKHRPLSAEEHAFVTDCLRGRPLAVAMAAARTRGPHNDVAAMISGLLQAGLFTH